MKKQIEVRQALGEELDEVIVRKPEMVHFEVMSDQSIWCGIYTKTKSIRIWISSKNGKSHIHYTAEVEPFRAHKPKKSGLK